MSLPLIKYQLHTAAARFAALTEGVDHPRVDTARSHLEAADAAVTHAAGGLSPWARTWLDMAVLAVVSGAVATFTGQLLGLSSGWTIAITVVVLSGLFWPTWALTNAMAARIDRRRTTYASPPPPIVVPDGVSPAAEVLALLRMARDELSVGMARRWATHRFAHLMRNADGFAWLCRYDRRLFWLSRADRQLVIAAYSIELWLSTQVDHR